MKRKPPMRRMIKMSKSGKLFVSRVRMKKAKAWRDTLKEKGLS